MKLTILTPTIFFFVVTIGLDAAQASKQSFSGVTNSYKQSGAVASDPKLVLLSGAYSGDFSVLSFDPSTNKLSNLTSTRAAGTGPSWATWDASANVYVADDSASVSSASLHHFTWDASRRRLTPLDTGKSGLKGTVQITRSKARGSVCLYAAGYAARAISSQALQSGKATFKSTMPLRQTFSGSGPDKARQDQSRPHQAIDSPDGRFVYAPDLGTDSVHVFSLDDASSCTLTRLPEVKVAPGDGPRHMSFYVDGAHNTTYAYLVTELSGTIRAYKVNSSSGNLELIGSPLNVHLGASSGRRRVTNHKDGVQPSEPMVSPDGRFVYVANRHLPHNGNGPGDEDAIALFERDSRTGFLRGPVASYQSGGRNPRHASLSPDKQGSFIAVANQADDSSPQLGNSLAILKRNATDGSLKMVVAWPNVTGAAFAGWWTGVESSE